MIPVMFMAACVWENNGKKQENNVVAGDRVPAFEVTGSQVVTNGHAFVSPDVFEGKKTLLVFFVVGCPDCKRELPYVQYAMTELSGLGLKVIAIGRGETYGNVVNYWTENDFTMPAYLDDEDWTIFRLFASAIVPRIYLIDEEGTVVWVGIENLGYGDFTEENGDKFVDLVKEQLKL